MNVVGFFCAWLCLRTGSCSAPEVGLRYPNGKEVSSYQNSTIFPIHTDVYTFNATVTATQLPNPPSSIPHTGSGSLYSLQQLT